MMATRGRVRVVHLVPALNVGGMEKVVLDLVRLTDRTTFAPYVLCLREKGTLAHCFDEWGVPVESLGCAGMGKCRTFFRLLSRLRQLRPHVLHTHNPSPHFFGALSACLLGIPALVHTKHGRNYPDRFRSVVLNWLSSRLSQSVVAVSGDAARVAREVEHIPRQILRVIRNGVDLTSFPPTRDGSRSGKRALHVARLNPVKDQKTLLRAARLVVDAEPDFCLDIAGDGPARAELTALAEALSLGQNVRFLGYREDVGRLCSEVDLFVLSSLKEGLSLTLLEAMASALPVVATDVGGNPEVVLHEVTGLLVPPRCPESLAAAMLSLLRAPARAKHLGLAGRKRVEEEFDLKQVVTHYERLYSSCLARHSRIGR